MGGDHVAVLDQCQVVVDVGEGQLQHLEDELVPLRNEVPFHEFKCGQAGCVHLGQGIDVVGAAQLSLNLHD